MKILRIRGENLASLAGPFEIDLEHGPLGRAGLFAITGPVGAGKSTLLDAMCLALFDRTPRLAQRGGTATGGEGHVDALRSSDVRGLLRRGASEGFAEVEFTGRDRRIWRARWSVRRARSAASGRLQKQTMSLTELATGRVIGENKTTTLAAIEAELGLNFEQFCRSVVLAQGDFALFLRAPAAERAALLERLTATEIYGELSRAAYARASEASRQLEVLEQRLAGLSVLDDTERARLHARIAASAAELGAVERLQRLCAERTARADELERRAGQRTLLADEVATATRACERIAQAQARARARRIDIDDAWQALGPQFERARELDAAIERLQRVIDEQGARLTQLATELDLAATALQAVDPTRCDEIAHWTEFRRELERHNGLRTAAMKLESRCAELLRQLAAAEAHHAEANRAQATCEARVTALAPLPDDEAVSSALELATSRLATLQHERDALRILLDAATLTRDLAAELTALEVSTTNERRAFAAAATADDSVRRLESELSAARAELRLRDERASLADHRERLVAGEPCALCGATEHPFRADGPPRAQFDDRAVDALARRHRQAVESHGEQRAIALGATARIAESRRNAGALRERLAAIEGDVLRARAVLATHSVPETATARVTWAVELAESLDLAIQSARREQSDAQARQRELAVVRRAHEDAGRALVDAREASLAAARAVESLLRDLERTRADLAARDAELTASRLALEELLTIRRAERATSSVALAMHERERNERIVQRRLVLQGRALADVQREHERKRDVAAADVETATAELLAAQIEFARADAERAAADDRVIELRAELTSHDAALAAELAPRDPLDPLHTIVAAGGGTLAAALAESAQRLRQELDELRTDRKLDERECSQRDQLASDVATKRRATLARRQVGEAIGSADGSKFRRFAQGMSFAHLLAHANRHLRELTSRYKLVRAGDEHLDLEIVDLEMGEEIRSVRSLSGGETFLVSLALALGLASMAARHVRLETLFIDEGLGTLDVGALESVLAALDALQATGYQVGVVSHIEGLAERVSVRIEVSKCGGGRSTVVVRADEEPPQLRSSLSSAVLGPLLGGPADLSGPSQSTLATRDERFVDPE